ncbi:YdbL family protein [Rhodanobacter sp. B2A1Ga4]|uniref:YdbL family protein n=1 Tax=Rhodanobacter sp. B2A1Ga4 TaxID=2778647 RepID=UPI001B371356|nr:YdbL family protein [Rhodanobacter sp. B2A1Ga4]MBQ4853840.1 YdbL family protein [Rhodanobacter sp. B2A1Ga4]
MRKLVYVILTSLAVALVGCVTINVYFPEAAAQKAADQFIGNVLDQAAPATPAPKAPQPAAKDAGQQPSAMLLDLLVPAAHAADTPDIRIRTAATDAISDRMQGRFQGALGDLLDSGAVGFTHDGMVAMRDAAKVPLSQRAQANATVADENRDRTALYREIANANNHPEWEAQIRATFAKSWIEKAHAGWYYQNAAGAWQKK